MSFKSVFLLVFVSLFCMISADVQANNPLRDPICNAPAPINFHVIAVGPTWSTLTWVSANPGDSYRIRTYKLAGNVLVNTMSVPPGVVATVTGLQQGVTYYSVINVVCADGSNSPNEARSGNYDTIITDLLVIGREGTCPNRDCPLVSTNDVCTFPLDGTETNFKVGPVNSGPEVGRRFDVKKVQGSEIIRTTLKYGNAGQDYVIQCDGLSPNSNTPVVGAKYQVLFGENPIAEFQLSRVLEPAIAGQITCTYIESGYEIVKMTCGRWGTGGRDISSTDAQDSAIEAVATPNPFTSSLEVVLSRTPKAETRLQLYNLHGQVVLEQQSAAGEERLTVSTASLLPGFYMLRVDAEGMTQTMKVVKLR